MTEKAALPEPPNPVKGRGASATKTLNLSDLPECDFEYWSKMSYWTAKEAVFITLGLCPESAGSVKISPADKKSPIFKRMKQLSSLLKRAQEMYEIDNPFSPQDYLEWLQHNEIEFPEILAEKVFKRSADDDGLDWTTKFDEALETLRASAEITGQSIRKSKQRPSRPVNKKNEAKPLHTKEKETLLKMIAGMAVDAYGYDPSALRSPIPKEIADILVEKGMPLDSDTVRKWLKEAAELLPQNTENTNS